MTVYTTSGNINIPNAVATATIIAKGEGGSGAPVSGSSYGSGSNGGNTSFIGVTADGGGGAVTTSAGGGGGFSATAGYTVVDSSSGNPGQAGGNFSSNVAARAGGTGNEGGDGSAGGASSYSTTSGGGVAFTTGGCGFYPSCGSFTVCGTSFCCPNCAGPGSGVLFQTNTCCYPIVTTTTYTRGGGGGEGGFIHATLDASQISSFAGTTQNFTVNGGGSNLDNGSLEVIFTLRERNPIFVRLSTGWTLMTNVSVNVASDGWTDTNPSVET